MYIFLSSYYREMKARLVAVIRLADVFIFEVSSIRGGLFCWLCGIRFDLIPACQKRTGFSPVATSQLGREAWMPGSFAGNKARKGEFHS